MYFPNPHHILEEAYKAWRENLPQVSRKHEECAEVFDANCRSIPLRYAWSKFNDDLARTILNSYLLAQTSYDDISKATGVPIDVLKAYGDYFFDDSVFRDRLDRISYVEQMCQQLPPREAQYYRAAIVSGSEYITWLVTGKSTVTPKDVLQMQMADSMYRSQTHRTAPLVSETSKEAKTWGLIAQKAAVTLNKIDPQDAEDALEQLTIALTHKDETLSAEQPEAPRIEDILH